MAYQRDYDHLFKLVLIGDSLVGKSKVLIQYADDTYSATTITTIGVDFRFRNINVMDKLVKLQIWDTAGQEKFRTITSAYYRGAHAIILCFDITNEQTFKNINKWNDEADRHISEVCQKILVGTKCDLVDERQVSTERAQTYADSLDISYWETSAKNNTDIDAMFNSITIECIIEREHKLSAGMKLLQSTNHRLYSYELELNDLKQLEACYSLMMRNQARRMNKKLRNRLERGLGLILDVQPQMLSTTTQVDQIVEIIEYFSNYLIFLNVVNRGNKEIFNEIIKCVHKCKAIQIRSYNHYNEPLHIILCGGYIRALVSGTISIQIQQLIVKYFGALTEYRDTGLYHNAIASCSEFECDIDDFVVKIFVDNTHNEWNQFQTNLKRNRNLRSVTLNINNSILNNNVFTKILCDICNCIAVNNLKSLTLCFYGDVAYNMDTKHYRNVLHSSIAKCYVSQASVIEEISLNYSNTKQNNTVQFFSGNFVSEIIKNNFIRLQKMDLNLLQMQWNHVNLMHVYQAMQSTNIDIQYLNISGKLFEKHFDIKKDTEIIQLLMEYIAFSHLNTLKLGQFSDKSLSFCIPLLSNMLLNNANVECIELSFDNITIQHIYSLLDGWLNRMKTLYEYYRNIREYIFGLQMFDDSVKEIIMEYIQMQQYTLRINSSTHQLSNKLYLISEFATDKLIHLLPNAETHNVFECVADILKHIVFDNKSSSKEESGIQLFMDNVQIANDIKSFNDSRIDFLSKLNYMVLCYGFVRKTSTVNNIYIPHEIFTLIYAFYPIFDVWAIGFDQLEEQMSTTDANPFLPIKWHKLCGLCDEPKICDFGESSFHFKREQDRIIWYEVEFEDDYKDISISYATDLNNLEDEIFEKWTDGKKPGSVTIISEPKFIEAGFGWNFMDGMRCMCMDNGDVIFNNENELMPASLFLLNEKSHMIDIQCSIEHVIFLTSTGNVFCFGDNNKGQCGVKNEGDITVYKAPVYLKKLSSNVIKKIFVGLDCNFCIDRNDSLHCFGSNENNKLGLKPFKNDIVWEPMLHSYFRDNIHLSKVCAAKSMNIFIDKQHQCYLTKRETQKMCHWQAEQQQYKYVKIVDVMAMDEIGEFYFIIMFDTENNVTFIYFDPDSGEEEIQEKTICGIKMHGIDANHRIEAIHLIQEGVIIITSPHKQLTVN